MTDISDTKTGKDPLQIDNWTPISLLNVDYKILALSYANSLKTGLSHIISESQTGFMKGHHIINNNNSRLVLDIIDYSAYVDSNAIILFLDCYKLLTVLSTNFYFVYYSGSILEIHSLTMYKDINSTVIIKEHF